MTRKEALEMTAKEALEKKWEKDMYELVESCTVELVTALQITVPKNVPSNIRRAIRFLYEKTMEKNGVCLPIIFVEREVQDQA